MLFFIVAVSVYDDFVQDKRFTFPQEFNLEYFLQRNYEKNSLNELFRDVFSTRTNSQDQFEDFMQSYSMFDFGRGLRKAIENKSFFTSINRSKRY